MSLERIKKYCEKFATASKVLIILTVILIICQTICFMWQALMPGKLTRFFDVIRIYELFTSNIDNNPLALYELGIHLFSSLFVFLMLVTLKALFLRLAKTVSLSTVTHEMKKLAVLLAVHSVAVPFMESVCYKIFIKQPMISTAFDLFSIVTAGVLYFIAVIIQSKAVLKENQE